VVLLLPSFTELVQAAFESPFELIRAGFANKPST
jgi:hypothetical protein